MVGDGSRRPSDVLDDCEEDGEMEDDPEEMEDSSIGKVDKRHAKQQNDNQRGSKNDEPNEESMEKR